MKLSYFELLSPDPVQTPDMGSIISPKLRDISAIGYNTYQYYLSILLMDVRMYFVMIGKPEQYDALTEEEKNSINIFECLISDKDSILLLQNILNFFLWEDIRYSPTHHCFLVQKQDRNTGIITADNYAVVCDLICQRNCIQSRQESNYAKAKNKKALEIMKKIHRGRAEKNKQSKADKNMELGNIISAVAGKSQSLNILNIWDLTVYQIWDSFSRLSNNNIYAIQSMSVAAWGNQNNYFDAAAWFQRIDTDNHFI